MEFYRVRPLRRAVKSLTRHSRPQFSKLHPGKSVTHLLYCFSFSFLFFSPFPACIQGRFFVGCHFPPQSKVSSSYPGASSERPPGLYYPASSWRPLLFLPSCLNGHLFSLLFFVFFLSDERPPLQWFHVWLQLAGLFFSLSPLLILPGSISCTIHSEETVTARFFVKSI